MGNLDLGSVVQKIQGRISCRSAPEIDVVEMLRAMPKSLWLILTVMASFVAGYVLAPDAQAATADHFFAGRVITFIVGTGPGGGVDLYARLLSQYMGQYIPGKPTLVVQNMPGAAGVNATNYIYNIAHKDGTVIATVPSSVLLAEALDPSKMRFNSPKLNWIGTIATETDLLALWKTAGIATLEEAKHKTAVVGAVSQYALSALEPELANAFLGTKFKIVTGYSEAGDAQNLAMERHEIDGRINQWASWKVLRPDWIRENKLSYVLQFGPKAVDLPGVPTMEDLVSDPADKAVVGVLDVTHNVGRSVFAPPDLPAERLKILKSAFEATMRDESFIKKIKQSGLDIDPRPGEVTQQAIVSAMTNRDAVIAHMKSEVGLR